jgi:hypothetical protein
MGKTKYQKLTFIAAIAQQSKEEEEEDVHGTAPESELKAKCENKRFGR